MTTAKITVESGGRSVLSARDYFRHVVRRRQGSEPPEVLLGLQDRFDTHFLDSPAWQRARSVAGPHQKRPRAGRVLPPSRLLG